MVLVHGSPGAEKMLLKECPKYIRKFFDIDSFLEQFRQEVNEKDVSTQIHMRNDIQRLEKITQSPHYFGTVGEFKVLKELERLNDHFMVFCDLQIDLGKFASYKGKWNLKSAQMDFVVVGPRGVFVTEVKNWSNDYLKSHNGFSPYEQLDRAGTVMYYYIQNELGFKADTSKVLVAVQNNMKYNPQYRAVLVRGINNFVPFIEERDESIPLEKVGSIVDLLKN